MSKAWDSSFTKTLLEASNYRSFMVEFFKPPEGKHCISLTRKPRPLTYSEFSRRAGFLSRAYIRDILIGKKRVIPANFERICRGLKLEANLREYLRLMVAIEEPAMQAMTDVPLDDLIKRTEDLRRKILKSLCAPRTGTKGDFANRLLVETIPTVYAACGTIEQGATLDEIMSRARLPESQVLKALEALEKVEAVCRTENRFMPIATHISLEALGGSSTFQNDFERAIRVCRNRIHSQIQSDTALFFTSTLCIAEKALPKFKEELRQRLLELVTSHEDAKGDCISEVVVAFTSNHL